ncbi:MAG: hypothetical protein JW734_00565 [Candidatus Omnitrophica bacterium]|nr:hypothetical protein [Candidatus Omnitrophota bacterium]
MFYEEILKEFNKKKVKFIIVGGVAFNLLGGVRATQDLDMLISLDDENINKAINILLRKGYKTKQPVDPKDFANKKIRQYWIKNKNMKAFNLYKDYKSYEEVDIIIDSPISFKNALKKAKIVKIDRLKIPVISIDHLIKMKKASGREQDNFDIKELRIIKKIKKL